MGIRCLVPFLRKLRSVYGPSDSRYSSVTNSLLGGNRRDSERIETTALLMYLFIWQQLHLQPMAV